MQLRGALDNEIRIIVERFVEQNNLPLDVNVLYNALQRSNSSLKRRPKKTLEASLERVVEFLRGEGPDPDALDSEAISHLESAHDVDLDAMNRSLRANLVAPRPADPRDGTEDGPLKRAENGESLPKRAKRSGEKKIQTAPPSDLSLNDVGGMGDVLGQLRDLVVRPLRAPEVFSDLNIPPPQGILLHGPPGCGKTMISRALAAKVGKPFIEILGPSVVSSMSGDSEKALREIFDEAKKQAPCIVFIDEIDAIAPKRDSSQSQMEKRIVAQLLVSMDELHKDKSRPIIVLAATNRPDSIDPALRRGGRFGTEINIGVPNERVREQIIRTQTRNTRLSDDVNYSELAKLTAGFVGADLHDLVSKAGSHRAQSHFDHMEQEAVDWGLPVEDDPTLEPMLVSINRFVARTDHQPATLTNGRLNLCITMADFLAVLPTITPSSKREGFATIPDVSWRDVGALQDVSEALREDIVYPIQHPELYAAMGLTAPSGVLLWGPPGCGKTLLARAAAAESKANFISIKGPELLNKFVGESEAAVRKVFTRARSSVPCIIFFDELDALVPKRDSGVNSGPSARVVNTLLTELDGVGDRQGIYVVAATNRPDVIDEAVLRPGRFGKHLYVDVPGPEERVSIFKAVIREKPYTMDARTEALLKSPACDGYSGADLDNLLRQAALAAIRARRATISLEDLEAATRTIRPSVQDAAQYRALRDQFGK